MKHEPRPAIHMEKQLGWAPKLGGSESLGISRAGQTVLARLVGSQIWHQPSGSVGPRFRKGTVAAVCLDASHFTSSLYATGAFQTATPGLELRGRESE